jgi:hypothetical protein
MLDSSLEHPWLTWPNMAVPARNNKNRKNGPFSTKNDGVIPPQLQQFSELPRSSNPSAYAN